MPKNGRPYILICTLHSPPTTSTHFIRNFRKVLGEENVITCGPERSSISWDLKKGRNDEFHHNIEMPKKDHPHLYSYTEIFDKCRDHKVDVNFDLVFIAEPNFCAFVEKDCVKPKGHIAYYCCDTHRGPRTAMKNMVLGHVNSFVSPNEYYLDTFNFAHMIDGVQYLPDKKIILCPTAYDDKIHRIYEDEPDREKYDVIFVGNDGIDKHRGAAHEEFQLSNKWATFHWKDPHGNDYRTEGPHPCFNVGCCTDHRFYEYGHRAEMLCRLKRDFPRNFKILPGTLHAEEYARKLNQGKIVFNCSIAYDLNMRVGEAIGCERVLMADKIVGMDQVCGQENETYIGYKKYYHPLNVNVDIMYDIIKHKIMKLLENPSEIKRIQNNVREWKKNSKNTYEDRCRMILEQTIGWR